MFLGVSAYTLASKADFAINGSLAITGAVFLLLVAYLFFYSRKQN